MQRIIKFRVWDKRFPVMNYSNQYSSLAGFFSDFEKFEVMQYTGLKDSKGKEIYEGDIVNDGERIIAVCWSDKFASFCLDSRRWMFTHFFAEAVDPEKDCEVIGNIYENSELLGVLK